MHYLFGVLLSAVLLWCAFPPVNYWPVAWTALVPLFLLLDKLSTKRAAFGWAYLVGFLFFLFVIQWIHYVTGLGLVFLAAYLALYFGVFGFFYQWAKKLSWRMRILLIPAAWIVLEWMRGWVLTGFGWGAIGQSQAEFKGLIQLASVTGVAGVSFVVVAGNLILKEALISFCKKQGVRENLLRVFGLGIIFVGLAFGGSLAARPIDRPAITVAIVQPNISLREAWNPLLKSETVRRQLALSATALKDKPDLIIWPETAFPSYIWELPELFDEVKDFARAHHVSLLLGAVTREKGEYFNSAILISPEGKVVRTHSKRHLVVFGEYIPFRRELPFLEELVPIDDFTPGREDTVFELPNNGAKFSVLVCFEDTVPESARRFVQKGADFLVNMTNDAWFEDSGQPKMHLENAIFRTVENGRSLVRATNTGESCFVDSDGTVGACVENAQGRRVQVEGIRVSRVTFGGGETLYTKYGEIFTFLCFIGILGAVIRGVLPRRRI